MRRFALRLGATAPAAAAALTAFFTGFGLGSYVLGRVAPRLARPLRAFACLEIAWRSGLSRNCPARFRQPCWGALEGRPLRHSAFGIRH